MSETRIIQSYDLWAINEKKNEYSTKDSILGMRKIPKELLQVAIQHMKKYTRQRPGAIFELELHKDLLKKIKEKKLPSGFSMGIDAKGYFVHTHRARCKSFSSPEKIGIKEIKFIDSTG